MNRREVRKGDSIWRVTRPLATNASNEQLLSEIRIHLSAASSLIWQLALSNIPAGDWNEASAGDGPCACGAGECDDTELIGDPTSNEAVLDLAKTVLPLLEAFLRGMRS
jgi:hypothetical protein